MANLFKKAKDKGATASPKPQKEVVLIGDPKFHINLSRLAEVTKTIDELTAEAAVLSGEIKERSIKEFIRLYDSSKKYPGSFIIRADGIKKAPTASLMFIPTDKYIKIGEDRYKELKETYGEDIVVEKTTYTMDEKLVEKYGEIISNLIEKCKQISKADKEFLITATSSYEIKKGTISDLPKFSGTLTEMVEEIKPIFQMKSIKIDEE